MKEIIKKELRVGNYIDYENTTHIIRELHSDKVLHTWINSDFDGYYSSYNEIHPIILTPEILKKAGFENINSDDELLDFFIKANFTYSIDQICGTNNYRIILYDGLSRFIKLSSLHHFQNCYYYLSGEELILNL